jgi:hypothetical protein
VDLTYIKQGVEANGEAGDQYRGLDRFRRIIDQRWRKASDNTNWDRPGPVRVRLRPQLQPHRPHQRHRLGV